MWDEKKFFDDFAKESDVIQPSQEFLENMVSMVNGEAREGKVKGNWFKGNRVVWGVAAALLLLISITGIHFWTINNGENSGLSKPQLQAGKNVTEESNQKQGSIKNLVDAKLMQVKTMMEDSDVLVTNEQGNAIDRKERKTIASQIIGAKRIDQLPDKSQNEISYTLQGKVDIIIKIIDDKYLLIDNEQIYLLSDE